MMRAISLAAGLASALATAGCQPGAAPGAEGPVADSTVEVSALDAAPAGTAADTATVAELVASVEGAPVEVTITLGYGIGATRPKNAPPRRNAPRGTALQVGG